MNLRSHETYLLQPSVDSPAVMKSAADPLADVNAFRALRFAFVGAKEANRRMNRHAFDRRLLEPMGEGGCQ